MKKTQKKSPIKFLIQDFTNGEIFYEVCTRIIARKYRLSPEKAEDAYQNLIISVIESGEANYNERANIETYLSVIYHKECINLKREEAKEKNHISLSPINRHLFPKIPSPLEILIRKERMQKIYDTIQKLSPTKRKTVILRALGMSYEEIARTLQIPKSTALSRVHKSKRTLIKLLDKSTQ